MVDNDGVLTDSATVRVVELARRVVSSTQAFPSAWEFYGGADATDIHAELCKLLDVDPNTIWDRLEAEDGAAEGT